MAMGKRCGAALAVMTMALLAGCDSGPNSIGAIVYDPTGLAFSHRMKDDRTLNVAVGLGGFDSRFAHGHVDYIMYFDPVSQGDWNPYWGLGVGYLGTLDDTADDNDIGIGLRVPLGISYQDEGWDFFAQLAAHIGAHTGITGAIGVRFDL